MSSLHFELTLVVLISILIEYISTQEYEPLAIIKRHQDGGILLATPDPNNKQQFEINEGEKLLCFCPAEDETQPLIPISKKGKNCQKYCTKEVIPTIKHESSEVCAREAYFTTSGYEIDIRGPMKVTKIPGISRIIKSLNKRLQRIRFVPVVNFCHYENNQVLYVIYQLEAPQLLYLEEDKTPSKSTPYLYQYEQRDFFTYYEKENQRKSFQKLFPNDYERYFKWPVRGENDSTARYIIMQQLAASEDMVLNTWKIATFYSMNTAPMWISVSEGSWKRANRYVRLLSHNLDVNFLIITGTFGNLIINNKPVFLYDSKVEEKIPVPLIFWKFLYYKPYQVGLVIVVYNDIDSLHQDFCRLTPCPKMNQLQLENFTEKIKGIVFCCKFNKKLGQKLNLGQLELPKLIPLNAEIVNEEGKLYLPPIDSYEVKDKE